MEFKTSRRELAKNLRRAADSVGRDIADNLEKLLHNDDGLDNVVGIVRSSDNAKRAAELIESEAKLTDNRN